MCKVNIDIGLWLTMHIVFSEILAQKVCTDIQMKKKQLPMLDKTIETKEKVPSK